MTLYFENETGTDLDLPLKEIYEEVAREVLKQEGCPYEAEVSLTLCDGDRIKEINREFRDKDSVTDVLSFPMLEYDSPGDFDGVDEDSPDAFNPETGELMLGDIIICLDRVRLQAEEYGHSERREFAFLIAHSMLHLLGFDHENKEEEGVMFEKQERALSSLGINR